MSTTKFTPGPNVILGKNEEVTFFLHKGRCAILVDLENLHKVMTASDLFAACEELVALWDLEGGYLLKSDSPSIVRARTALEAARSKNADIEKWLAERRRALSYDSYSELKIEDRPIESA